MDSLKYIVVDSKPREPPAGNCRRK